jgi:saccharopine dehydrogenase-like NADP-dependent oxidoreductase
MNVVLYTEDFEPITVLDLPVWLLETMERHGGVRVAVLEPLQITKPAEESLSMHSPKIVTIYCEKLRWKDGSTKPVLITYDEELALMLRPSWLTGQQASINSYKQTIRSLTDTLVKAMRK